jgi:WD40 repeat protein
MKTLLQIIILLTFTVFAFGQTPKVTKYFNWYNKNYIIQNPSFAHSDTEILFVRQFYIPDGHDAEGREQYVESLLSKADKEKRFADPVVSLLNLKTKKLTQVDYGWTPTFSSDDKRIIYSYQTVPISGKRVLAETLNGNKIKIFNRLSKQYEIIASPEHTFLLDPMFLDSTTIVYKIGDAVNGAYGGGVAFNQINLLTKTIKPLYTAQQNHSLFNLVGDIYKTVNGSYYTIYIPQDSSTWMANKYSHLLMDTKGVVHDFGKGSFRSIEGKLGIDEEGNLIFLDDDHDLRADKNILIKYKDNKIVYKKELTFEYNKASISPNGKYLLFFNNDNGIFIMDTNTFTKTKLTLPDTEVYSVVWSDNSTKLAIVQGHEKLKDTDLISLFDVK